MSCKVYTTKSMFLTLDPGGMSTFNWRPTGVQVSESSRSPKVNLSSDLSQKPTGSSTIKTPEESCKRLNLTERLGESQNTRLPKRLAQPDISVVNIDESSFIPSVKGVDPVEASSEALRLPPLLVINHLGESDKLGKYIS